MRFVDFKHKIGTLAPVRKTFNIIREQKLKRKFYLNENLTRKFFKGVIFCVDGHIHHGGFADRMFGLLETFALCKIHNVPFKVNFTKPFNLEEFLIPNKYNWHIDEDEITYDAKKSVPVVRLGDYEFFKKFKFSRKKQIHYYANCWVLDKINEFYKTQFSYKELFSELFRKSAQFEKDIKEIKSGLPKKYTSVCIRHQNTFGDFQESSFSSATPEMQKKIIRQCKDAIKAIQKDMRGGYCCYFRQ